MATKSLYINALFILILKASLPALKAQNDTPDVTFGTNGTIVTTAGAEPNDMVIEPDDKITVV